MCSVDGLPYGRGLIASVVSPRGFTHGKLHGTVARCRIEMFIWREVEVWQTTGIDDPQNQERSEEIPLARRGFECMGLPTESHHRINLTIRMTVNVCEIKNSDRVK